MAIDGAVFNCEWAETDGLLTGKRKAAEAAESLIFDVVLYYDYRFRQDPHE